MYSQHQIIHLTELLLYHVAARKCSMFALTPLPHVHVYILEQSQHKVPEEALAVSNTDNTCPVFQAGNLKVTRAEMFIFFTD